ncbi:hypothetical protein ACWEOE_30270 [Amycolatopsis sp. NPDC004368]
MTSAPQYPPPAPVTEPGAVSRQLAGILGVFSAALVVAGTFLPIAATQVTAAGQVQSSFAITAWNRQVDVAPQSERDLFAISHVARFGIPLSVAAAVLVVGALLAFTRLRGAARTMLIAGGAAVAAAVWTVSMDVSASLSFEQTTGIVTAHYTTGTGFWVLLGGGVIAVLVLALAAFGGGRWTAPWLPLPYPPAAPYPATEEPVIHTLPDPAAQVRTEPPGASTPADAAPPSTDPWTEPPADRTWAEPRADSAPASDQTWAEPSWTEPAAAQGELSPESEPAPPLFPPQDVQPEPGVDPPGRHRDSDT